VSGQQSGASAAAGAQTGAAGQPSQSAAPTSAVPAGATIVYGFFRDPLWPGPGQRFVAANCSIGLGATIIHYCPSLPPLAEAAVPPEPLVAPAVLQCNPWFQFFPVCRRVLDEAP